MSPFLSPLSSPGTILVAGLLAAGAASAGLADTPGRIAVREKVATTLKQEGLTGATWALVTPESGILVDAAGVKDTRSGAPLSPGDRMHVGSVAKTLLATGVLKLVSEGRVALDAPVAELLPELRFDNPWAATHPIRLRHLLDHNAGLDDTRLHQVFSLEADADAPLASSFSGKHATLAVRSRPGSRFSYSNTSYTLAGMVIEKLTGERYETYLDRELLHPLGMYDSTFRFVTQEGPDADPRLAMGHFEEGEPHRAVPIYQRPASQLTTTAADMARFATFLMGDGQVNGQPFIAPELLSAMGQPQGTEALAAGLEAGYGLGLLLRDRHGVVGRCHSGSTVGFRAMLCLFRDQQRAFFMSTNTDSETANEDRVDAVLIEGLGLAKPEPVATVNATDARDWEGFYVPSPNRFAAFEWLDSTLGFVRLRAGWQLELTPFLSPTIRLYPVGEGLWRAEGRVAASHVLLRTEDGRRVLSTGTSTFERASTALMLARWVSLVAGMAGFAWLLMSGLVRLIARRLPPRHPVFLPLMGLLALLLPLPFFLSQSFLAIGDVTTASVLLAIVSVTLPLALVAGLWRHWQAGSRGATTTIDVFSILAGLQLLAVLAWAGWVPARLWA
jgi:CubicO group peptidase (beta-lactamase class C family)